MLSKQQEQALELLKLWTPSDKQLFVLSGYSGTGKSFLTRLFLEWYREQYPNHSVAVLAPSHKAAKNIQQILVGLVEVKTISSFLGLTPQIDQKTGVISFGVSDNQNCSTPPSDFDLVIVDEFSMIDHKTVLDLNNQCKKVLYLGDPAQLPPIGEDFSIVPTLDAANYQLTDVIRYSGDLAKVAHSWRKDTPINAGNGTKVTLKRISSPTHITTTPDETILELSKVKWITQYCQAIEDGANVQLLTFTNKACDKWNSFVRSEIWAGGEPYCVGDRLIAKSPLFRQSNKNRLETAFNNSSEFVVSGDYSTANMQLYNVWYQYYSVPVTTEVSGKTDLFILAPHAKHQQQAELDRLKTEAIESKINGHRAGLWGRWHQLKKTFDDVSFSYAITTHKAQGSTYDAVYLDLPDISKCRDIERITYTALTRSKQAYTYV
jgi:AAA domain/UvrD-like helicase C-terminal domain